LTLHEHSDFINSTMRSSSFVLLTKYSGDQIKKDTMGGSCGTYGGLERCIQCFGRKMWVERDHLEDL